MKINSKTLENIPEDVKRVIIVANKWWEAKPLIDTLFHYEIVPFEYETTKNQEKNRISLRIENYPALEKQSHINEPRITLYWKNKDILIEIWCISDIMRVPPAHKSSTEEKVLVLPQIFKKKPDFVIAFGTAAYPSETSYNGCVVLGTKIFIYNPFPHENRPYNPDSRWNEKPQERGIISLTSENENFVSSLLKKLTAEETNQEIEKQLLTPPLNPAKSPCVIANKNNVSIGVVNITNYKDYDWADHETFSAAEKYVSKEMIKSMETTHGVIRLAAEKHKVPFCWISGIADRMGYFQKEVAPRPYAQNFVAGHNAAIVTAWLIASM